MAASIYKSKTRFLKKHSQNAAYQTKRSSTVYLISSRQACCTHDSRGREGGLIPIVVIIIVGVIIIEVPSEATNIASK